MESILSVNGFVDILHPNQGIGDVSNADFSKIAIDLGRYIANKKENILENFENKFLPKCKEQNLKISTVLLSFCEKDIDRTDFQNYILEFTKKVINLCGQAGIKYVVINLILSEKQLENLWYTSKSFFLNLVEVAKQYGVKILLQNQCKNIGGHFVRGLFSEPAEAVKMIDNLNEEAGQEMFGFCLDVGVCNLCGNNMYDFVCMMGKRIKSVIIRDCETSFDNCLLPFSSVNSGSFGTDWLNLIRGLRKIDYDGKLIFDINTTANSFSVMLRPQLLLFTKSITEYFEWQLKMETVIKKYSSRVLFGAGNMCKNYMECYGELYPPLFSCDNNSKLWGSKLYGIEIKNPEELKNIPKDCVILICNIYYREIEQQLRNMNIENPIEYFNDEYMPMYKPLIKRK